MTRGTHRLYAAHTQMCPMGFGHTPFSRRAAPSLLLLPLIISAKQQYCSLPLDGTKGSPKCSCAYNRFGKDEGLNPKKKLYRIYIKDTHTEDCFLAYNIPIQYRGEQKEPARSPKTKATMTGPMTRKSNGEPALNRR